MIFTDLFAEIWSAFDETRQAGILIGEQVWNFADFMTKQEVLPLFFIHKKPYTH